MRGAFDYLTTDELEREVLDRMVAWFAAIEPGTDPCDLFEYGAFAAAALPLCERLTKRGEAAS